MNAPSFKKELLTVLQPCFPPERGYDVRLDWEVRNHSPYLTIQHRSRIVLELPLNMLIDEYKRRPDMVGIVEGIQGMVKFSEGISEPEYREFSYAEYDLVKENLAVKLEPVSRLEEARGSVYEKNPLGLLCAYFRVITDYKEDRWLWTRVPIDLQKFYGVSQQELMAQAIENTSHFAPVRIYPIQTLKSIPMSVVTTFGGEFGATALLYPGVQKEIQKQMHGDYYVLPLNIHEAYVIKKASPIKEEQLRKFQAESLQRTFIKDYLSDQLFEYNQKERGLVLCGKKNHQRDIDR